MFNINLADDWTRTTDLWFWKQPLYQLSHNHYCPQWSLFCERLFVQCPSVQLIIRTQRDQIGRLLKVLDNKFYFKSSPNIWKTVWAFWKALHLKQKLLCLHFRQVLNKLGYFLFYHLVTLYVRPLPVSSPSLLILELANFWLQSQYLSKNNQNSDRPSVRPADWLAGWPSGWHAKNHHRVDRLWPPPSSFSVFT